MSVPLDRLYQYIERVAQEVAGERIVIYRFFPHGSKKLEDLLPIHFDWPVDEYDQQPVMYCHDQEPLDWLHYQAQDSEFNLRQRSRNHYYDKCLLLHSEQRSKNLEHYRLNGFVPVYYWSHAVIARDWFRYAEHCTQHKNVTKTFLIYNRAWSGTREYRLKLMEHVVQLGLVDYCKTTVNAIEPELGIHYSNHAFVNSHMKPTLVLEKYFQPTDALSSSSADFDLKDYESTDIEVVLETLFDNDRIQLTEKILRPIALGQPFILASTPGSLDYLRSYGFKTFENVWDEGYDTITNPVQRIAAIADVMHKISNWTDEERKINFYAINLITEHNRQHFFSQKFSEHIMREFHGNIKLAHNELLSTNTGERRKKYQKH
jgi:hypothetical protein